MLVRLLAESKTVADPITVGLAVLAWLLVFGFQLFVTAVKALFDNIPFIGGQLGKLFGWAFPEVTMFWAAVPPFSGSTQTVAINHATEQGLNVQAHNAHIRSVDRVHRVAIPAAIATAQQGAVATLQPFVDGVNGFIGGVQGFIAWQHAQDDYLRQAVDQTIPQEFSARDVSLGELAHQSFNVLPTAIAASADSLQQQIAASALSIRTDLGNDVKRVEAEIGPAAAAAQAGAVAQVAPQIDQVRTDLGALAQNVADTVAPALGIAITATEAIVGRVTQVEECTAGICSTGSGNILGQLGNALNQLAPFVEDGLLIALAAAVVADTPAVARQIVDTIGTVVDSAGREVARSIGLAA